MSVWYGVLRVTLQDWQLFWIIASILTTKAYKILTHFRNNCHKSCVMLKRMFRASEENEDQLSLCSCRIWLESSLFIYDHSKIQNKTTAYVVNMMMFTSLWKMGLFALLFLDFFLFFLSRKHAYTVLLPPPPPHPPLKHLFYTVNLKFTGVYFSFFCSKS